MSSDRRPSTPRERWFDGAGIRIHGLDWGGPADGPVLLLLHGVGGNAWIWADVAARLRTELPSHRIVAIDQRDGGDTEHPAAGYDRDAFRRDVVAVHDALGGRPMVLVGHSRAGWLASWIAATHPERIDRLVLVDPARLVFGSTADADVFFAWVSGSLGPFESEAAALDWAQRQDRRAVWGETRRRSFLFGLHRLDDGRLAGKLPPEIVPLLRQAREGGEAVTEAIASIRRPTLLIVADRQSPARLADKLEYARRIPDVTVEHIDGSHFVHTDAPDEVARSIAAFSRRSSSDPSAGRRRPPPGRVARG